MKLDSIWEFTSPCRISYCFLIGRISYCYLLPSTIKLYNWTIQKNSTPQIDQLKFVAIFGFDQFFSQHSWQFWFLIFSSFDDPIEVVAQTSLCHRSTPPPTAVSQPQALPTKNISLSRSNSSKAHYLSLKLFRIIPTDEGPQVLLSVGPCRDIPSSMVEDLSSITIEIDLDIIFAFSCIYHSIVFEYSKKFNVVYVTQTKYWH